MISSIFLGCRREQQRQSRRRSGAGHRCLLQRCLCHVPCTLTAMAWCQPAEQCDASHAASFCPAPHHFVQLQCPHPLAKIRGLRGRKPGCNARYPGLLRSKARFPKIEQRRQPRSPWLRLIPSAFPNNKTHHLNTTRQFSQPGAPLNGQFVAANPPRQIEAVAAAQRHVCGSFSNGGRRRAVASSRHRRSAARPSHRCRRSPHSSKQQHVHTAGQPSAAAAAAAAAATATLCHGPSLPVSTVARNACGGRSSSVPVSTRAALWRQHIQQASTTLQLPAICALCRGVHHQQCCPFRWPRVQSATDAVESPAWLRTVTCIAALYAGQRTICCSGTMRWVLLHSWQPTTVVGRRRVWGPWWSLSGASSTCWRGS